MVQRITEKSKVKISIHHIIVTTIKKSHYCGQIYIELSLAL